MAKKTRWFPCSIKPVRSGWYEIRFKSFNSIAGLCLFNGGRWRKWNNGEDATGIMRPGHVLSDRWRGLAK